MQELKFTSCLADPLSLLQGQEKCMSQLIHSRNDKPNRTGIDPVNGRTQFAYGSTQQTQRKYTHTPKTSSQIRPSLVPLRHFAQLPLLGQHKPDQGEASGAQSSSCGSCGPSSVEADGVPMGVPPKTKLTQNSSSNNLLGRDDLQWHFVTLILWIALGEVWVNLDIWLIEWMRNHNTHPVF